MVHNESPLTPAFLLLFVLFARVGISTAASSAWLGLCLNLKYFRVDVTTSYHPQLGITRVSCYYSILIKKKMEKNFHHIYWF